MRADLAAPATIPVVRFTIAGVPVEQASAGLGRPYTVVYDGACRVCQRIVRALTRWDRDHQLELVPSQGPGVRARFPWIPERSYAESVQLIAADGQTWQGAAAVERIIDLMPKGWLISWVFSLPFVRPLAERLYRWFARYRYRLGCGKHCQYRQLALDFEGAEATALPAPSGPPAPPALPAPGGRA
jgi:predicted DCC family thiol-disulfide oxidoreductase YuxK